MVIKGNQIFPSSISRSIKMFSNGVEPIETCFEILKFQIIYSIEEFRAGFGNSNDFSSNLDFIV